MPDKVYECVAINILDICTEWEEVTVTETGLNQLIPQLSQPEQTALTLQILSFMALVFVIKQIKRSI